VLPRNPTSVLYDGRDRVGATRGIVMSRSTWPTTPGSVLADATEVYSTTEWGTNFIIPVGENEIFPTPLTASMFELSSLFIQASKPGTVVQIDKDANGTVDLTVTLNQGESYYVDRGVLRGATVVSSKPVQVNLLTGDIGGNYECRWYTVAPAPDWGTRYYSPVGTAANGNETFVFLYNPDAAAITVNVTTRIGVSSISIPSKTNYIYQMPQNSGASFINNAGKQFYAIATVGAKPTANNVNDWGFSLVQEGDLTTSLSLGWGPGSSEVTPTVNGNPVWVTPIKNTTVYVDYKGDRAGPNVDPLGARYDVAYQASALEVLRLFDPSNDQTGMRIYTLDGTLLAGAWGQDPATAGPGNPFLDAGTTIPAFPTPVIRKSSAIAIDAAPSGLSRDDTMEYTIVVDNAGLTALGNLNITDTLPSQLTYVLGSTTRDGVAIPDDALPATRFPLDVGGYNIPLLPRGQTTTFKYRATINTAGSIANTVVSSIGGVTSTNSISAAGGGVPAVTNFSVSAGTNTSTYNVGDGIYVTVADNDANTNTATVQSFTVIVRNTNTGDYETITLTETGPNTGVFRNTTPLASSSTAGLNPNDGTLNVYAGNSLSVSYTDPIYGESASASATITSPVPTKVLYLSTDGIGNPDQDLDRIDPVVTLDTSTASTANIGLTTSTVAAAATTTGTALGPFSSMSVAHTTGTGANRLMMVAVNYEDDDVAGLTVNSVTYNGLALTRAGIRLSAQEACSELWYLLNPPSGTFNVVVNASSVQAADAMHVGVTTFTGVNQSTPFGTVVTNTGTGTLTTVTVASAVGELVYATMALDDARNSTVGAGQTELFTGIAGVASSDGIRSAASTKPGAASVTSTWTVATDAWATISVSIKPAVTPGTLTFVQTPGFAENLVIPSGSVLGGQVYYAVASGTMPASPAITASLRYGSTTVATSNSVTASGGLLTFGFPALTSAATIPAGSILSLDLVSNQSGVTFRVEYDSDTRPSRITLPTSTVIHTDTVAVYDAPYPGGNIVSAPANGQILYVRAQVGDPFGAYDITSLGLVLDGPGTAGDINTNLTDANVVATTASSKIYQYQWRTGATSGQYSVIATAREGFEGTVTSQRSTSVNLTFLDLGTPSTVEFFNSTGATRTYGANESIIIRVTDLDKNRNAAAVETVTVTVTSSSGDTETITLTETGPNTGVFTATLPASSTTVGTSNNGTLYAPTGSALGVTYVDSTDPTDVSTSTASVPAPTAVDGVAVSKTVISPASGQAIVGQSIQYRVRVVNTGGTTLNTVAVTDTFPTTNLTYVSATTTPSSVSGGTLTWSNVGPLAQGQAVEIFVNFTATGAGGTVNNTASVTAGTASSTSTAPITITRPRLTVTKTVASPTTGTAGRGDLVVFSIAVQNSGSTAIPNLPLEDMFSAETFEYVSASLAPNATGSGSLLWNDITGPGSLAVGATQTISVTLRVRGEANPAVNNAVVNYATDANGDAVPPASSTASIVTSAASIKGLVLEDKAPTGFGAEDTPLAGVTVSLYSDPNGDGDPSDGVVLAVTTTAANGSYEFLNLALGNYVVVESDPIGYSSVTDIDGVNDNRIKVTVTTLTAITGRNFLDAYINPALYGNISGQVRNDVDADGDLTDPDSGIDGVTIELYTDPNRDGDPSDGSLYASTVTSGTGAYSFNLVPPGNYVVIETDKSGFVSTADKVLPNDNRIPLVVTASTTNSGNDFLDTTALTALGAIGDLVWSDTNNNGAVNSGEAGIPNVLIQLYRSTQNPGVDVPYRTATTGVGGIYAITGLPVGSYVAYLPASNFASGGALASAPLSSNAIQSASGQPVRSAPFNVVANTTNNNIDFGFVPNSSLGTISGTVLEDTNNDDIGDVAIAGVTLTLFTDPNGDGNPADGVSRGSTTTASNGSYSFTNVPPGRYVVVQAQPSGFLSVTDTDGGTDNRVAINLLPGGTGTASFVEERPGRITGHLYIDTNGNGTQQAGEPNLANVNIIITDSLGGTTVVETDSVGNWEALITPGAASAKVDTTDPQYPAGAIQTEGTDPTAVTLVGGVTTSAGNDGYFIPALVQGRVYRDANGNGLFDAGDSGLQGVIVRITDSLGIVRNVTTNSNGNWSVSVPPGTTIVDVLELDATFPAGGVRTAGSDPLTITATAGATNNGGTTGYYFPGTVVGHLYLDVNGNGVQDGGEPPLANINVVVTGSNGATQTVTTNAAGNWTASVPPGPGNANVDESSGGYPAGSVQSQGVDPTPFTAIAAQSVSGGINGYYVSATVIGHLYRDVNGNGVEDAGDTPLAQVSVQITDSLGVVRTVETDVNGNWTVSVPPGATVVDVVDTDPDIPAGSVRTEGTDPTTVTAIAGATANAGKDGYYLPATVTGHLYVDSNGNGQQDAGEPGLANVDVVITDSLGVVRTVTTNGNGDWTVQVPPGSTIVDVNQADPDFPAGGTLSQGTDPTTVTAVAGQSTATGPIGYRIFGVLAGHLYIDVNNNGTQNAGEPGLAGIDVVIVDSLGTSRTVETDASGNWTVNVAPGNATVTINTSDPQFPAGATLTEGVNSGTFTAVAGTTVNVGNNGYYVSTLVMGTIYVDVNNNTTRQLGEPGLAGVSVVVTDVNGPKTVITNENGVWVASVAPGNVTSVITESGPAFPSGFVRTEGTGSGSVTAVGGTPASVPDTGYYFPGTISGQLFTDTNGNGVKDGTEGGLADISIIITDSNGNVQTVVTDSNGNWTATVPPGPVTVDIDNNDPQLPAGAIQTAGSDPVTVTAVSGQNTPVGGGAGFFQPATVSGHLFTDTNGNGIEDAGEPPLAGVTVFIADSNGVTRTVETDANGNWTVSVPPGTTVINVDKTDPQYPAGATQTAGGNVSSVTAVAGSNTAVPGFGFFVPATIAGHLYLDLNGNGNQDFVVHNLANVDIIVTDSLGNVHRVFTDQNGDWSATVPPGPATATVDSNDPEYPTGSVITQGAATTSFNAVAGAITGSTPVGFFFPATINGHLYMDTNGNGNQDNGEPNLANVDLVITSAINNTQRVSTDASGNWTATVPPGSTTVDIDETDPDYPAGSQQTEGTDPTIVTAIGSASVFAGNDGFYRSGTISGHLFSDTNGNGQEDSGEPGLSGVSIVITDSNGATQTVTTDANGNWTATVPPGAVTVDVADNSPQIPAGATLTTGSDPTTVTAVAGVNTPVPSSLGYFQAATVIGHLYFDTNGNGIQDAGEAGLANVDVMITTSTGVLVRATADVDGNWTASVPPGSTSVAVDTADVDFPAGVTRTEGTDPTVVNAVAGTTVNAGNDGYFLPAVVSGLVYRDENGNGSRNGSEPAMAGVSVRVTDSLGVVRVVLTDANGIWTATVPPGATVIDVVETDALFPDGWVHREGTDPNTVTAVAGVTTDGGRDGYYFPATLTGVVFLDRNGNGTKDPAEQGIANLDVLVTSSTGFTQTVVTDASGRWVASVPPGPATVRVGTSDPQFPTGAVLTAGQDPASPVAVAAQTTVVDSIGYYLPATVTGIVYFDTNGNGTQQSGENGLSGVLVNVTNSLGVTQQVATDVDGRWTASVPPGATGVDIVPGSGSIPAGSVRTQGVSPRTVTAVAGVSADAGKDGFYLPATVSGHLYVDSNGNGQQDSGEPGLPNVDVVITDSLGVVRTVTTDGNGDWTVQVPPGSTIVDVNQADPDFPAGGTLSQGTDPTTVTANAGQTVTVGPIGYQILGVVTGLVYVDVNNDGVRDAGEPGLAGIDITITDDLGIVRTVETDANGVWTASAAPGPFSAVVNTNDPQFPAGATLSEGSVPIVGNAAAGVTTTVSNQGYYISTLVTGTIYVDVNNDRTRQANEPGLAGVSVVVTDINGSRTVVTNADGVWVASVAPGNVTSVITESGPAFPSGFILTEGSPNGQATATGGTPASVPLTGYFFPGTVFGHLYLDVNGNGVQDGQDLNLADVDVVITDSNGTTTVVTTDSSGNWSLSVAPGAVSVDIDENDPQYPAGSSQTEGTDPTLVTAVSGQQVNAGNDGFFIAATIAGHLFNDTNGNGIEDPGEPPLVGVTVFIADSNGVTRTVVTDANGNYSASVPPGTTVVEVDEDGPGYPAGSTQTAGSALNTVTAVAGGTTQVPGLGFFLPATITGHLYLDLNGNGTQDFTVHNLANVNVIIIDSLGRPTIVVTDQNGDWRATVPPGAATATIDTTDPEYPTGSVITQGAATTNFTAVAGTSTGSTPVGFFYPATINGHLYVDTNGNGTQDSGEPDLADVDLVITSAINNTQRVTTDVNGNWVAIVPPGTTIVDIDETDPQFPATYQQSEGTDPTQITAVASVDTFAGNDGFYLPGSVSGRVYLDVNNNGTEDAGDSGIGGVDVVVTDSTGVVRTVTTDGNGDWTVQVPPGSTSVDVNELDTDIAPGSIRTQGTDPTVVNVTAGLNANAGSHGFFYPATIRGFVRADLQNDGIADIPLPGVTIQLRNSGNAVVATTSTAANGAYSFTGLVPGVYFITQIQPDGYISVSDADGGNPDVIGDVTPVVLVTGGLVENMDFLERAIKEPNRFAAWQNRHPLGGQNGLGDNPDGDQSSNLIEYAFAADPASGAGSVFCLVNSLTDPNAIDAVYTRTAGGPLDVTYRLEAIPDLGQSPVGWVTVMLAPQDVQITSNGDGTETVRILNLEGVTGLSGAGFVRLRVLLDTDNDGNFEAEDVTETGGWVESAWGVQCRTYGNPFVSCPQFSGVIDSVNGQQIILTTSASGVNLAPLLPPGATYYLEVVAGDWAGHRFDIASAGVASLTLANDTALFSANPPFNTVAGPLPATLAGDRFVIRTHSSLGRMFPTSAFGASTSQDTADQVQTFANGAFVNYWLYSNGGSPVWVRSGDASLTDQVNVVIPPDQGTFINTTGAGSLLAFGKVRANDFVTPLTTGNNLVRSGYPLAASPLSRGMTIPNGFDGDRDFKKADEIYIWRGDAAAAQSGYDSYFLLDGAPTQPAIRRWAKVGDVSLQAQDSTLLFRRDASSFIKLMAPLPGHKTVVPWQP